MYKAGTQLQTSLETTSRWIGDASMYQFKSAQTPKMQARSLKEVPATGRRGQEQGPQA